MYARTLRHQPHRHSTAPWLAHSELPQARGLRRPERWSVAQSPPSGLEEVLGSAFMKLGHGTICRIGMINRIFVVEPQSDALRTAGAGVQLAQTVSTLLSISEDRPLVLKFDAQTLSFQLLEVLLPNSSSPQNAKRRARLVFTGSDSNTFLAQIANVLHQHGARVFGSFEKALTELL